MKMASTHNLLALVSLVTIAALVSSSITIMVESRTLPNPNTSSLVVRLKLEGEPSNCWESLWKLQACSSEILTFFLNGETHLGHGCCQAITVIGHDCWPTIVASLGFTSEETHVLEGYCDQLLLHSPPPPKYVVDSNHIVP